MAPSDTTTRHGSATIALHWLSALLLIVCFTIGLMLEDWPRGPQRDTVMMVHYSIGTVILGLVMVRLLRRLLIPSLAPAPGISRGADRAARAMHWILYAMMIALPFTGAFDRWARGRRLAIFDIVVTPPFPIGGGRIWREAHTILGYVLAALVVVHVAAALWHALVRRDEILARMLPRRGALARSSIGSMRSA